MKNKLKDLGSKVTLAALLGFIGYYSYDILNEKLEKKWHFEKLNKYGALEGSQIDSAFPFLNYGLRENLNKIYVIKNEDLLAEDASAETHFSDKIICLTSIFDKRDVYHESAHLRHRTLDDLNFDFSKKWKQIANFEYGSKNYKFIKDKYGLSYIFWKEDSSLSSKHGMIDPISSKNIYEDVANFVESLDCIDKRRVERMPFPNLYPIFLVDTSDHRYQKKLDLLLEYNFFTKEEHEKLSKNLGSLNYLLRGRDRK